MANDEISQKEKIAQLFNQKVEAIARGAAERMGKPYGTTDVDLHKVAEIWNERDPNVDEQTVWQDEIQKAAQALAADPSLNKEDVLDELPINVAMRVFPKREEVIKSMGGLNYQDWVTDAEKIEKIAAPMREKDPHAPAPPEPTEPAPDAELPPPPDPAGLGSSGPPDEPVEAVQPVHPSPPGPPPMLPAGPGGMPGAGLSSGAAPNPMMTPAPGAPTALPGGMMGG